MIKHYNGISKNCKKELKKEYNKATLIENACFPNGILQVNGKALGGV